MYIELMTMGKKAPAQRHWLVEDDEYIHVVG